MEKSAHKMKCSQVIIIIIQNGHLLLQTEDWRLLKAGQWRR